jgi:hypothetical protein
MTSGAYPQALFAGLIYNEDGQPAEVTFIGVEPHYVILDGDFRRHVPAETVDRQVLDFLQNQAEANRDLVTQNMLAMLGKDDLFTKAMIDSSIHQMHRLMEQGLPDDARTMLGMVGFKIIVNTHGELVNLDMPGQIADDDES